MQRNKLFRIATIPLSLEKLLRGQLVFMNQYYPVTAISSDKKGLEQYGKKEGVKTHTISLTRKITIVKDLHALWKLYKYLIKEKPLIVHTHTPKAGIIGMMAAYIAKVPIRIHTISGLPFMERKGSMLLLLKWIEKLTYHFATQLYSNSHGLKTILIKGKYINPKKILVLNNGSSNGIHTQYFSRSNFFKEEIIQKKEELGIPQEDFVFVFVGRIVKDKGINELVKTFIKLQKSSLLTSHCY